MVYPTTWINLKNNQAEWIKSDKNNSTCSISPQIYNSRNLKLIYCDRKEISECLEWQKQRGVKGKGLTESEGTSGGDTYVLYLDCNGCFMFTYVKLVKLYALHMWNYCMTIKTQQSYLKNSHCGQPLESETWVKLPKGNSWIPNFDCGRAEYDI